MSRGSPAKWDQPEVRRYVTYCTKSKPHKLSENSIRMISVLFVTRNWKKKVESHTWRLLRHCKLSEFWYAWNVDVRSENPGRIAWNQPTWWFMLVSGLADWLFSSLGPSLTLDSAVWVEFKQCQVKTNRRVVKRGSAVLGSKPDL